MTEYVNISQGWQEELNQLHAHIVRLEEQRDREARERRKEQSESLNAATQHRLQMDRLKRFADDELQQRTADFERIISELQRKIQELEGEMISQRQEITATYDRELRQREHEFNLKSDEMCAVVLSHNLKVNLLCSETEAHRQAQMKAAEALKASEEFSERLKTRLQQKDQEIENITAVKDQRIKELKEEVEQMETKVKETNEENTNKYESLIQTLKECDARLETQCQTHSKQLQKNEKRISKLQGRIKVTAAQLHSIQTEQQGALQQKEKTIKKLCNEIETIRTGWDECVRNASCQMVAKDSEMITLQDRESKARVDLERSREEVERYKQQLCEGLQREKALEQKRVQVELEWQRQCEDVKAKIYLDNEKLIQELTQARDQAKAEQREKEQELQDMNVLLQSVQMERDQAVKGTTPNADPLASEQIRHMQEQNSVLRAVVAQMRQDMEHLGHPTVQTEVQHPGTLDAMSTKGGADAQHAPYLPALPTQPAAVSSNVSHAVNSLKSVSVTEQPSKDLHPEAAVANIMDKNALLHQLREENTFLRQQLSTGLFENVHGTKDNNYPGLRKRLKQAASCIVRLSKDKQHLIELGNRLRAQITTTGQQVTTLPEPEKETSTEKQGEQHDRVSDRLSALEQLQYQLTTQELQYTLRQTDAKQILSGTNKQDPAINGSTENPWNEVRRTTHTAEGHRNKENCALPSQSQGSLETGPQLHTNTSKLQFSSLESLHSLKELWATLDCAKSSSSFSEGNVDQSTKEITGSAGADLQIVVHGVTAPIHSHAPSEVQRKKNPGLTPIKSSNSRRPGPFAKTRNYNIKD
ncbi:coiled-coil domain-containing protein 57 isoform X2 [Cynoglossus semilaevis]|uniref:coiled-coil domain-containing protein 57 isoform X2 n=1 Tax=Cynoglossus semilaevis TaxID=244447 RepID=UPI0007DC99B5|nr:coiled-coil domain-containing protein 57 isoform X2 [Cynoglossus semilaevis]